MVTKSPKVGDIVCYDENRKVKFIVLDTFHAGTFPAAWETVGVVVLRKGNQVTICSKYNESKKFMEVYPYIVSGYTLDGVEHTAQLRLHGRPGTDTWYEFKYTANTDSEFVTQLKQFLTDSGETDWSAYLMDGKVYLQYDNYTSAEYLSASITQATGITLEAKCEIDMPQIPSIRRKCGNNGHFVWNAAKTKQTYINDRTDTAYNPSSDLNSVPNYPVCYPAFCGTSQYQDDHCLYLRERYCKDPNNPTIAEWKTYIDDITPASPVMIGAFAPKWRGRDIFDNIKDITYTATDRTQKPLYPGANYCSKFLDGKGYMLGMYECNELFKDIAYGLSGVSVENSDPINRSLFAIGGNTVSLSFPFWLCGRILNRYAYVAVESGNTDGGHFCLSRRSIPIARMELPVE